MGEQPTLIRFTTLSGFASREVRLVRRSTLGQDFRRLWSACAVNAAGSAVGMGELPLIALLVLDSSAFQVSLLTALSAVASALIALPLGVRLGQQYKRPVMITADGRSHAGSPRPGTGAVRTRPWTAVPGRCTGIPHGSHTRPLHVPRQHLLVGGHEDMPGRLRQRRWPHFRRSRRTRRPDHRRPAGHGEHAASDMAHGTLVQGACSTVYDGSGSVPGHGQPSRRADGKAGGSARGGSRPSQGAHLPVLGLSACCAFPWLLMSLCSRLSRFGSFSRWSSQAVCGSSWSETEGQLLSDCSVAPFSLKETAGQSGCISKLATEATEVPGI